MLFEFLIFNLRIFVKIIKIFFKTKKIIKFKKQKIVIFSHFIHSHNYKLGDFYYKFLDNDLRKKKLISQIFLINDQKNINNPTLHNKYVLLNENVTLINYSLFTQSIIIFNKVFYFFLKEKTL